VPRIVHLGLGNFHRAHQAWYTSRTSDWSITGVVMSNRALRDDLRLHNNQYLLGTWGNTGLHTEVISIFDDVLLATEQQKQVIEKIADRRTSIVSLTVTEKGYYLKPDEPGLNLSATAIKNDLASDKPCTAIGLLAEGLIHRMRIDAGPITILSCDNLSDNGHKLQQAVVDYLAQKNSTAIHWLNEHVSFPNSMVDRITPKLSDDAKSEIAATQLTNRLPVVGTEQFSEWIIADEFVSPRPPWENVGVLIVPKVAPFEERKLRLLNASHSFLAYAGLLAGHQYIHEAIADETLKSAVDKLWDEATVAVSSPAADTLHTYRNALLERFAVPEIRHELNQIAMDGSVKLRERLVPILNNRLNLKLHSPQTCRAIATWMAFIKINIENGDFPDDPNINELVNAVKSGQDLPHYCVQLAKLIGLPQAYLPL